MASATLGAPASTRAGRRFPALLVSRVIEQGVLGGASLLLAARLGTVAFAPIAALFVVNSAAVTLSDYGVGLAVLRCAPGEFVRLGARRTMRIVNWSAVALGVVIAAVLAGDARVLVASTVIIWLTSGEAFVQKAGAINAGVGERAALAEVAGAAAFALPVVAFASGTAALAVVAFAFPLKHLVETVLARHDQRHFAPVGTKPDLAALWGTQALAFGVSNVDYVVVASMLGASAFSIYTIAYRFAVAIPSTVAYVASRTAVADLSAAENAVQREARYVSYVRRLFGLGALAAAAMAGGAFLIPAFLGSRWEHVTPSVIVLSVAVPWRMTFGQAGALAVSVRRAGYVVRWTTVQVVCFGVAFAAAAQFGYAVFVTITAVAWVVSVTLFERGAATVAGIRGWRLLHRVAVVGVLVAVVAGMGLKP